MSSISSTSMLSERQKDELHKSILDYFKTNGLHESYATLMREAGQDGFVPDPKAKYAGLLEKKWTSVIRLQKKIMEMESRMSQLQEELAAAPSAKRSASLNDWVPRAASARHSMQGHRMPVTKVSFHPSLARSHRRPKTRRSSCGTGRRANSNARSRVTPRRCRTSTLTPRATTSSRAPPTCPSRCGMPATTIATSRRFTATITASPPSPFCRDGFLVSASRDKTIKIWELATGFCTRTLHGHAEWVRSAIPSDDGRWLLSCSTDQTARIWDLSTGETKVELRDHDHVVEVAIFAPVSAYAALRELAGLVAPKDASASAPGQFAATGSRDKTIKIWDSAGQCLKTLTGHDNWVRGLAFSPNGKNLLSVSDDKTMRIWDLKTGRCAKTIDAHAHFCTSIAWGKAKIEAPIPPAQDTDAAAGANGSNAVKQEPRTVNVVATSSVDLTIKIWTP